ncbi:MAG: hypothetical protein Q6361_09235 [Candidatus Hermodarchaeota archaeon]|jgi:hypothetical protein|nr:hypothetical protein [Candidatus Hermodarchaeota archaeon]
MSEFKPKRHRLAPLKAINYRAFLVPILIMVIGALIWGLTLVYWPTNLPLIVWGQVLFMIGMFVAIILGFWVMTIIRLPAH